MKTCSKAISSLFAFAVFAVSSGGAFVATEARASEAAWKGVTCTDEGCTIGQSLIEKGDMVFKKKKHKKH